MSIRILRGTRSRWAWIAVVVALGAATYGGTSALAARDTTAAAAPVDTAGFPTGGSNPGIFTDRCLYSHEAADDPILAPGSMGMSMHHDFFGNTSTDGHSTASSLLGGATTCSTTADASAYWTPVLYQDGRAVTPASTLIYWRQQDSAAAKAVQAIPAGLQMVAGDESATTPPSPDVVMWTCQSRGKSQNKGATAVPHDCTGGSSIKLTVSFPSCWDGHTLAGADQTDVVYPGPTGCPASHPVVIPQIVFHAVYPTSSGAGITLSMTPTMRGSADTEHVDFINGWNQATLTADVRACIATSTRCGEVTGAQATPKGPNARVAGKAAGKAQAGNHH